MYSSRVSAFLVLLLVAAVHQTAGLSVKSWAGNNNNNRNKALLRKHNHVAPVQASTVVPMKVPHSSNPIDDLYNQYLNWIDRQPLVAKSVTAAVIGCVGDVMAQWLEAKSAGVYFATNWVRVNAFFISGLLFVGPFLHTWYEQLWTLGRYLDNNVTKNKNAKTLAQVFVDQTIGVILFFPTYFYVYELSEAIVSLRAPAWGLATQKLTENLGSVFFMQYRIWPLVNFLNFSFVPERMRILTGSIVSVFWNAYLCTRLA